MGGDLALGRLRLASLSLVHTYSCQVQTTTALPLGWVGQPACVKGHGSEVINQPDNGLCLGTHQPEQSIMNIIMERDELGRTAVGPVAMQQGENITGDSMLWW